MENVTAPEEKKLKRYQVYNHLELVLDTARINIAQKKVDELKSNNSEKVTFIDAKEGTATVHTKPRYSKNYRVRKTKKTV